MNTEGKRSTNEVSIDEAAPPYAIVTIDSTGKITTRRLGSKQNNWLVVLFYPRNFSFVCPTEINAFSARYNEFLDRSCEIIGVSIDSLSCHKEWLNTPLAKGGVSGLNFALGTDPEGNVSKAYGVWDHENEHSHRGLFLIDPDGIVRYSLIHGGAIGRSVDETLRVLDAVQSGGLCPASWATGDGTLDVRSLLQPNRVLGHYQIGSEIGSGAFASVFCAKDLRLERTVALKVLRDLDYSSRELLMTEAKTTASMQHENICPIYAVEDVDGLSLIAMEYLKGPTLSKFLDNRETSSASAFSMTTSIAKGLVAAHAIGLAHGDLKPANIVVINGNRPVIVDFGLAAAYQRAKQEKKLENLKPTGPDDTTQVFVRPSSGSIESSQSIAGTPAYMSPEQASGQPPSPASDVFSLGLILYELSTGKRLLQGNNVVLLLESLRKGDYQNNLENLVDEKVRKVLKEVLAHDSQQRPSCDQIIKMLA